MVVHSSTVQVWRILRSGVTLVSISCILNGAIVFKQYVVFLHYKRKLVTIHGLFVIDGSNLWTVPRQQDIHQIAADNLQNKGMAEMSPEKDFQYPGSLK